MAKIKLPSKSGYYWIKYYDNWTIAKLIIHQPGNKRALYLFRYYNPITIDFVYEIGDEIKTPEKYW